MRLFTGKALVGRMLFSFSLAVPLLVGSPMVGPIIDIGGSASAFERGGGLRGGGGGSSGRSKSRIEREPRAASARQGSVRRANSKPASPSRSERKPRIEPLFPRYLFLNAAADLGIGDIADTIDQKNGKLLVDEQRRTSLEDVWAGGDCIFGHDDLTVSAVQDGKVAAVAIDRQLRLGTGD